jgi:DNA polymerase (family 10)
LTNKEIANKFNLLAKLMELHNENPFKIRSYSNTYLSLRRLGKPLEDMNPENIGSINGIGTAIANKIQELLSTGEMQTLNKYVDQTPPGIMEILRIKGLGAKKIKLLWEGLGIESAGELLYACKENRLVELKGFGSKTQEDVKKQLIYFLDSRGKFHYASLIGPANELLSIIKGLVKTSLISLVGDIRRKLPIISSIDMLIGDEIDISKLLEYAELEDLIIQDGELFYKNYPVNLYFSTPETYYSQLFDLSGSGDFTSQFYIDSNAESEEDIFDEAGLPFLEPELREGDYFFNMALDGYTPELIKMDDLKGVIHNHSTYSDGLHSLKDMGDYVKSSGYQYFVISDHSKSAFYANGLREDRIYLQWEEIDKLNESYTDFRIYKSIESDILSDGSLDYEDSLLAGFDLIIASIHSNLKMDEQKATLRLIKAIEHPLTRILGHPTGRLLLARKGYPIDYQKVIDACAANNVVIELNANPHRLDLDWEWIPYALEKEVMISINPDAHSKEGIHDMFYGLCAARKGGLTKEMCLNAMSRKEFEQWLSGK